MRTATIIIVASLALAGCGIPHLTADFDKYTELRPGVSTVDDAEAIIGPPASVTKSPDGIIETWGKSQWSGYRSIALIFDTNGRFRRLMFAQ